MKVLMVNYSDLSGGAAKAGYRLFDYLLKYNVDASLYVARKNSARSDIIGPETKYERVKSLIWPSISNSLNAIQKTNNSDYHSLGLMGSGALKEINRIPYDCINLHWICNGFVSIDNLRCINSNIVWTMHDMWAFCGREHYATDSRWRLGYDVGDGENKRFFDLNKYIWKKKIKSYPSDMTIVSPSKWMKQCVDESVIFNGFKSVHIANPIDTEFWRPIDKKIAREILGLDAERPYILFACYGGITHSRKGFDLLLQAMICRNALSDVGVMVLGGKPLQDFPELERNIVHYFGFLNDEISLKVILSAADVLALPSRLDNLPNMAVEAISCGLPVVGFDVGGVSDIVVDNISGFLAKSLDFEEFAQLLEKVLFVDNSSAIRESARNHAVSNFSPSKLVKKYISAYSGDI